MTAAVVEGYQFYSYDLQVETILQIDEMIYALETQDMPMLTGVGADGIPVMPRVPVLNTVFYWLEDETLLPRGTVAEALDNSETAWTVTAGEAVKFAVGDTIRCDDELVRVTAVDSGSDLLTVTRGVNGTSAVTHDIGSELIGLGTTLPEGDIGNGNFRGRVKPYNYTQIWTGRIEVSRTEQIIPKYGVPNELNRQAMKRIHHLNLGIEQSAPYGIRYEDSSTKRRQTGGLDFFIDNEDTAEAWLTVPTVETAQETVYGLGGRIEIIMAAPKQFGALNNTNGNERIQTVTVDDARRGRTRARTVTTEYGEVLLVRNRWIKPTDAFGYTREQFRFRVMTPLQMQRLAKTRDTDDFMLVTEGGFQMKGADHAYKWTGLDNSQPQPSGV